MGAISKVGSPLLKHMVWIAFTVVWLVAAKAPAGESVQQAVCPQGAVFIQSADRRFDPVICGAVEVARNLNAACGFHQVRPITIEVVAERDEEHAACAAYYDCDGDTLTILTPGALSASDDVIFAFRGLPNDEYFQSVIVHELTHAFIDHSRHAPFSRVAHEYLAYAVQIASLSEVSRNAVLETASEPETVSLDQLDMIAFLFGPSEFALRSYRHFVLPENGCTFADQIADADPTLPEDFRSDGAEVSP